MRLRDPVAKGLRRMLVYIYVRLLKVVVWLRKVVSRAMILNLRNSSNGWKLELDEFQAHLHGPTAGE